MLTALESPSNKGFLSSYDLTTFPIVAEILPCFLQGVESKYLNGEKSMESYKWVYNIVILNLYLLCLETISGLDLNPESEELVDIKNIAEELLSKLDPSIRHHIKKRGISIRENTYIGFDTEFTKKDLLQNKLVSAQLTVTTKTYVLVPKTNAYCISKIDENTNELLKQTTNSKDLNYKKIEMSIQMGIQSIRRLKYDRYDGSMLALTESLRVIKSISYTDQEEQIVFSLPRSIIQPYIHFGDTFSLKELILISSSIAKPHLNKSYSALMNLIREITSNDVAIQLGQIGQTNPEEVLSKKYGDYEGIDQLRSGFEQALPLLEEGSIVKDHSEQRLTRKFMTDLFPQKVSVTKTKNYYIIAHLTPADLSLLSDFEEIKEELSIVNGSFVTIGKPLKYCGRNIHIRDTMLLAPGLSKSLAAIGRLYGGVLNKLEIGREDLEDMQGFLARDKVKFTEYALRDALISLIHAS